MKFQFLILTLLFASPAMAQESKDSVKSARTDVAVQYEWGFRPTYSAILRVPIANNLKMNIGASWETDNSFDRGWRNYDFILAQTDTLLTRRYNTHSRQEWQVHNGLTLQLPWNYFSVSGDITLGIEREYFYNYSEYYRLDESGSNYYELYTASHLDLQEAKQKWYSAVAGFRQGFHFNLPIGNRMIIGLSATQVVGFTLLFRTDIESDPLGEFWGGWIGPNEVKGDFRATASLRFSFGKEKTFEKIFKKKPKRKKLQPQ